LAPIYSIPICTKACEIDELVVKIEVAWEMKDDAEKKNIHASQKKILLPLDGSERPMGKV
jgi:hypothetical protein